MTDSKHTPGPWTLFGGYTDGEYVEDADGFPIADIETNPVLTNYHEKLGLDPHEHYAQHEGSATIERPEEEWRANARLIAAAPELFEAVKRARGLLVHACVSIEELMEGEAGAWYDDDIAALDSIIAKAEGGAA